MRLFRGRKAISPIFAVLILIAIAVIAGIVVYMFTSGTIATMTGGGTAGQEKAAVQGVTYDNTVSAEKITAYATCVEGGPIDITGLIIKDSEGNTMDAITITPGTYELPEEGDLVTVGPVSTVALDPLKSYTVTLTSANGGSFVSSSFKP